MRRVLAGIALLAPLGIGVSFLMGRKGTLAPIGEPRPHLLLVSLDTLRTKSPEPKTAPLGHYFLADIHNRRGRPEEAAREVAAARRLERGR